MKSDVGLASRDLFSFGDLRFDLQKAMPESTQPRTAMNQFSEGLKTTPRVVSSLS